MLILMLAVEYNNHFSKLHFFLSIIGFNIVHNCTNPPICEPLSRLHQSLNTRLYIPEALTHQFLKGDPLNRSVGQRYKFELTNTDNKLFL